ncbi:hypothetical protein H9Q13_12665 [Pontibacter sp. JH31]|uniref:Outer membrane protein beta-barrel domain-containing protein n=1 Tax=Pontibacter aquaedesilientis TaxID=2766980 RepID=A0ABR7XIC4_9BACT|nr:hypothetical protein [Pontibacter aquaedesilientis]MBD1398022.1 hypothetical protein [Pontibacter aquaedesilientis]
MKALLFKLTFLVATAATGQDASYGLTGRFGAYKTIVSSREHVGYDNNYGPGIQLELGAWIRLHAGGKNGVQFSLLQGLERQSGGTYLAIDEQGNSVADIKTRYGSLSISAAALYLYRYSDRVSVGVGFAGKYKYAAIMAMQKIEYRGGYTAGGNNYYNDTYHRKLSLYVPLEAQVQVGERFQVIGQVQVPFSNRIVAQESAFKERDLGLTLGVSYTL